MTDILIVWAGSALLLCVAGSMVAYIATSPHSWAAPLIDRRGRFSLSHSQVVLWTVVLGSLLYAVFFGRLIAGSRDPLSFGLPTQVIVLYGVVLGAALAASFIKAAKDLTVGSRIAASGPQDPPRPAQVFLIEEGAYADRVVDITKAQNIGMGLVALVLYISECVHAFSQPGRAADAGVPAISGALVVVFAISQAVYVLGKLLPNPGTPIGLTVENRGNAPADLAPRNQRAERRRAAYDAPPS